MGCLRGYYPLCATASTSVPILIFGLHDRFDPVQVPLHPLPCPAAFVRIIPRISGESLEFTLDKSQDLSIGPNGVLNRQHRSGGSRSHPRIGADAEHMVEDIRFENVTRYGMCARKVLRPLKSESMRPISIFSAQVGIATPLSGREQ